MNEESRPASQKKLVEPKWVSDVLHFWFEELSADQWFAKSDPLDAKIHARFLSLHECLLENDALGVSMPREILAAVLVLDQFSRNLFRGIPSAFASDPVARRLANLAIEQGFDLSMTVQERVFLYLPFEHSEALADQKKSVALITSLGNEYWTRYAIAHKEIIERFGRFPHRNAVLDRVSSPDEIELLKDPTKSF